MLCLMSGKAFQDTQDEESGSNPTKTQRLNYGR